VVLETIQTLGAALAGIKSLADIASTVKNTEVRQELNAKIAELQGTLISARQAMLELQDKYEQILRENKQLKEAAAPKQKPSGMKWGCYQFEGEEGLFCTACYDSKGQKSQTTRVNTRFRMCPVCKAPIGTG
jgi:hypothetical protein